MVEHGNPKSVVPSIMVEHESRNNVDNDRPLNNGQLSTPILDANNGNRAVLCTTHLLKNVETVALEFEI